MARKFLPEYDDLAKLGLQINKANWSNLTKTDIKLISELHAVHNKQKESQLLSNKHINRLIKNNYDSSSLQNLINFLKSKDTFNISIIKKSLNVDGKIRNVSIVAATEIDDTAHGDMSSMLYLRDQVQVASTFMELAIQDPEVYKSEGAKAKNLLFSALDLLSTPAQLHRFESIINKKSQDGQSDWPQISLLFNDLEAVHPNNWRNKQDTWQMLAYMTFDAIERNFIKVSELTGSHKKFLGFTIPFLKAVGFPKYKNSGSWEEIEAVRTSVMAIETALLFKISNFIKTNIDNFIANQDSNLALTVNTMLKKGLQEIGKRLPNESPEYDISSVKFRDADAAIVYLLRYNIPKLLADNNIPLAINNNSPLDAISIENIILETMKSLHDTETNGIFRYKNDSYQRVNFHTNSVQLATNTMKQQLKYEAQQNQTEVNLDQKQALRNIIVPKGRMAAWTHPLGQISSWAAKHCLIEMSQGNQKEALRYKEISTNYLNRLCKMLTPKSSFTAALTRDRKYNIQSIPAFKLPECYIAYQLEDYELIVASPHTPLNWSTAMLIESINLLHECIK